jgi:zinc transport system substrate-binding protein
MRSNGSFGLRRGVFVAAVLAALLALSAALGSRHDDGDDGGGAIKIVTTLFPQYDFARLIAGNKGSVSILLPPGTESHTYDPRPGDLFLVEDADLFIYTGDFMEPWARRMIDGAGNDRLVVVDSSEGVNLLREIHGGHDDSETDGEHEAHGGFDPHFWLNPLMAIKMVENIERALSGMDPGNAGYYEANAEKCIKDLRSLDEDFRRAVQSAERDTLVFGGRFAFRYFMEKYGLKYVSAYSSCSEEAEPSVRDVSDVIEYVQENSIPCVFYEELTEPRVAKTIANAAGVGLRLLSTAHNVAKDEFESGVSFMDIMRANLESVKMGLGCVEGLQKAEKR